MSVSPYNPEHGGAIFYILFAIAMITALTFALNKGSQTSGNTLSKDKARLAAHEIIGFMETVASNVNKLKLRGFTDTQISFENNIHANYTNANCTQNACKIFAIGGGNLNYAAPNTGWLDNSYQGQAHYGKWLFVGNLNIEGTASSETDLILMLRYVTEQICETVNITIGLPSPNVNDIFGGGGIAYFKGDASSYTAAGVPNIADEDTAFAGKNLFCFRNGAGEYQVTQVLISR